MRVVYIADDGREFDNEWDCETYEIKKSLPSALYDIEIYDKDGKQIKISAEDFGEYAYNYSQTIIIKTEEELEAFKHLLKFTGWCEWEAIDSIGTWDWVENIFGYGYMNNGFKKREV